MSAFPRTRGTAQRVAPAKFLGGFRACRAIEGTRRAGLQPNGLIQLRNRPFSPFVRMRPDGITRRSARVLRACLPFGRHEGTHTAKQRRQGRFLRWPRLKTHLCRLGRNVCSRRVHRYRLRRRNDHYGSVDEEGWDATWNAYFSLESCDDVLASPPHVRKQENLPINCASWIEAYAFCIWDGGFLPSQPEWEYAAAGGKQQRRYPWGSTEPGTHNEYAIYGCHYPSDSTGCGDDIESLAPVGTAVRGVARWGQLDMVGEVSEWSLDWMIGHWVGFRRWSFYSYLNPCMDCVCLEKDLRTQSYSPVVSGAAYDKMDATLLLPPTRIEPPSNASPNIDVGFRCARVP
jgi:formylglycine-generating enzyme required for sulfatase activity